MIHPYQLKLKWRLTWDELAEAIGRDRRTAIRYRTKIDPDHTVQLLCSALDTLWHKPDYLKNAESSGLFVPNCLRQGRT